MTELKFFDMPEQMKPQFKCIFCEKGNCEVMIQENIPGGGMGAAHQSCLDTFMEEDLNEFPQDFETLYWYVQNLRPATNWKLVLTEAEDVDEKTAYAAHFLILDFCSDNNHKYVANCGAYAEGSTANEALINLAKEVRKIEKDD